MNRIRSIINRIWPDPVNAKLRLKVDKLTDRLRESTLNSDAKARQVSVLELRVKELESGKADLHRALTEAQNAKNHCSQMMESLGLDQVTEAGDGKTVETIYESPDLTINATFDDAGKFINSNYSV